MFSQCCEGIGMTGSGGNHKGCPYTSPVGAPLVGALLRCQAATPRRAEPAGYGLCSGSCAVAKPTEVICAVQELSLYALNV